MFSAWFKILTPFFTPIFDALKNLAMGIFIYRAGKKDVQLDNLKEETKNVKKSKKLAADIDGMSDEQLRDLLRASKPVKPKIP